MHELRVTLNCTSYELPFAYKLRIFVCCLSCELSFTYKLQVTSYLLDTSYKLLFIAWVLSYFLHMNYELLITAWVTSFILNMSYELVLTRQLRVNVYLRITFSKAFFVTLILTYLQHEKIWRSEEENTTNTMKICHGLLSSKFIPSVKNSWNKTFFSLRQGIKEALVVDLGKTLTTNRSVFK